MNEEPYRWLEAVANRREYCRDQLKGATPVFAVSRPEGILLLGVGHGRSKVFEIYDRHAMAALGNPVDIEKLRQSAIEAAHLEGFTRSPEDVTLRRLVGFALSVMLKNGFEQIFSAPVIVEALFAEVGREPDDDVLVRLSFDGNFQYAKNGLLIAHTAPLDEHEAVAWLTSQLKPDFSIRKVAALCLAVWRRLNEEKPFSPPDAASDDFSLPRDAVLEAALLERTPTNRVHFRSLAETDL